MTSYAFWHNGPEVSKLKGALSDLILFTRIDALIACSDAHELAHMLHTRHSAAFSNAVDKVLPDYRERKAWLPVNGAGMEL